MKPNGKAWKEINVRRVILIVLTVILCELAILSCATTVKRFCTVGEIDVEGEERYSEEMLLEGLGVEEGDWLYFLDTDAIRERMLRSYPFLLDVELRPSFPSLLRVVITERQTPWYIEMSGEYYALNENLLVIDRVEDPEGMCALILPEVQRVIAGSVPAFAEDETELRKTLEIIDTVRSASYGKRMTEVDVSDRRNIRLVVDGKFTVKLGNMSELDYKLRQVETVLESDRLTGAESAVITAENPELPIAVSVKMPPVLPEDTEESQSS
ncbi:MAG: FtsQ-type POTRA domain-containing protein [Clostridia bacterium]|nr:FtsQ-type POTRA domain-containing protein [Clostridia bacterium]